MPADHHQDFLRLYTRHEAALRAFVRACLPRPEDVDEVMQETSLVAWKKFKTLPAADHFPRWACLIARHEILKHRRSFARDRLVLDEDVVNLLADEAEAEAHDRHEQLSVLNDCIGKLARERRELALAAYAPGASKKDLARRLRRTDASVYQLLARIRLELLQCVERSLAKKDPAA